MTILETWLRRSWRPLPEHDALRAASAALQPVTVVTGASEGIGRALAERFAWAGQPLVLVARRPEPLVAAARDIRAATGVQTNTVVADLATPDGIAALHASLATRKAYCDVLVNNAGIGLAGPFAAQSGDDIARLIDLNIRALTLLMHSFLPGMLARGRGGILNVASLGGWLPGPHQAAYYASKAYVISLTEAVAAETRGQGVRVAVVAPGPVETAFHRRMGAASARYAALARLTSPDYVARIAYRGFRWGRIVIVPGAHWWVLSLIVRVVPHPVLMPITGWLLKRRG